MVNAICKELILQKEYVKGQPVKTIYFGGGTPSLLSERQLTLLLESVFKNFNVTTSPEITFEANPDDLSAEKLTALQTLGVNRLSIGVQSFDDKVLKYLNRAHNGQEALSCIDNARNVGINNISLDLIYAIPDRTDALWQSDLERTLAFKPNHISSYCLTIEPNTVFGRKLKKGELNMVEDDLAAVQFEILQATLKKSGYDQYEVSNFCLPGYESQHNSAYWKQEIYLGVGPSAHSYNLKDRQFNVSHNRKYLDAIDKEQVPFTLDRLSTKDKINDYLLTTLRTKWGADLGKLKDSYGFDLYKEHVSYIDQLINENKAVIKAGHLVLTKEGLLLADQISSDLFSL